MLSVTTVTDARDQRDHLVSDVEMDRGHRAGSGMFRTVCGAVIVAAALVCPPRSRCRQCMKWSDPSARAILDR